MDNLENKEFENWDKPIIEIESIKENKPKETPQIYTMLRVLKTTSKRMKKNKERAGETYDLMINRLLDIKSIYEKELAEELKKKKELIINDN